MLLREAQPHLDREDWLKTTQGDPRGYIDSTTLKELWFHTGTNCNLACPFCLEGSKPGEHRLEHPTLEECLPLMDEALELGVQQFSFTGGEPFIHKEMVSILVEALKRRPCMVLTNATGPLEKKLDEIASLKEAEHELSFRVSIDHPQSEVHDQSRGEGNFSRAFQTMKRLHDMGFKVSIARHMEDPKEDRAQAEQQYHSTLKQYELPLDMNFVAFPDFLTPGSQASVPEITENCMTTYQTEETRAAFMCRFSRMVVKHKGQMRVYACTLVDDDADYDLGGSLKESLQSRVMLKHHRCFSCFAYGASCSES